MNDSIVKDIEKVRYIEQTKTIKLGHMSKYKFLYLFIVIEILIILYFIAFAEYSDETAGTSSVLFSESSRES